MFLNQVIRDRIRQYRISKGLTQGQLAFGIMTSSMISQIENGTGNPSFQSLMTILKRLEVNIDVFCQEYLSDLDDQRKYKLAKVALKSNELRLAVRLFEEILGSGDKILLQVELQLEIGIGYFHLSDYDKSSSYLELVWKLALHNKKHNIAAKALRYMGQIAKCQNDYQISLFHTQRALAECEKAEIRDIQLHAQILEQIAELHVLLGNIVEALQLYEQLLEIYGDNGLSNRQKLVIYLNIAMSCHKRHDLLEKSEAFTAKALSLIHEAKDLGSLEKWQHDILILKLTNDNWRETTEAMLELAIRSSNKQKSGKAFVDIAAIYLQFGETDEAFKMVDMALVCLPHDSLEIGEVHRIQGLIHQQRGDLEQCIKYLRKAASIFEKHGCLHEYNEMTEYLLQLFKEQGMQNEFFDFLVLLNKCFLRNLH